MKKIILTTLAVFAFALTSQAQEIADNAIGLRFGSNDGLTEITYQRKLSDANRLEANLGWSSKERINVIKITGLYQWVMPLQDNFNWFAGAGGGLLNWKHDVTGGNSGTALFVAGDVGIEYHFDFPLMLALDVKPELGFSDDYNNDLDFEFGFSARYKF